MSFRKGRKKKRKKKKDRNVLILLQKLNTQNPNEARPLREFGKTSSM